MIGLTRVYESLLKSGFFCMYFWQFTIRIVTWPEREEVFLLHLPYRRPQKPMLCCFLLVSLMTGHMHRMRKCQSGTMLMGWVPIDHFFMVWKIKVPVNAVILKIWSMKYKLPPFLCHIGLGLKFQDELANTNFIFSEHKAYFIMLAKSM